MIVVSLVFGAGFVGGLWFLLRELKGIVKALAARQPKEVKTRGPFDDSDADSDARPLSRRDSRLYRS